MVNFKTMDKASPSSRVCRRAPKGKSRFLSSHGWTNQRHPPITETGTLPVRSCARFCGKYPSRPMGLRNYSKNFSAEENTPRGGFFILEKITPAETRCLDRPDTTPAPPRPQIAFVIVYAQRFGWNTSFLLNSSNGSFRISFDQILQFYFVRQNRFED